MTGTSLVTAMLPRLILTSGEPAGIGPDLCLQIALQAWESDLVVVGDIRMLAERARALGLAVQLDRFAQGNPRRKHEAGKLRVLHVQTSVPVRSGVLDPANAQYVLATLDAAIDGCTAGEFDAIVTAPIQKSIINDAGAPFSGHTEYLAERTGGGEPVMLLACDKLRVALVTTHLPLQAIPSAITRERIETVATILYRELRAKFAIERPRVLVCGLNPHAGESGHLGREEIDVITPALEALRARGLDLIGPAPADTAFTPHMLEGADAVLAMYHDQGLPVIKYAGFGNAVNVTLGLPIIRTSVDHGTALTLAGTGKADAGSLNAAIEMALQMVGARARTPA